MMSPNAYVATSPNPSMCMSPPQSATAHVTQQQVLPLRISTVPSSGGIAQAATTSNYPAHGQPTHGQPTYGQPSYGQPTYGQPMYGQPTTHYSNSNSLASGGVQQRVIQHSAPADNISVASRAAPLASRSAHGLYQPKDCSLISASDSLKFGMSPPYDMAVIPTYEAPLTIGAPPIYQEARVHKDLRTDSNWTGVKSRGVTRSFGTSVAMPQKKNICGC